MRRNLVDVNLKNGDICNMGIPILALKSSLYLELVCCDDGDGNVLHRERGDRLCALHREHDDRLCALHRERVDRLCVCLTHLKIYHKNHKSIIYKR